MIIASEHAIWLPTDSDYLQAIKCYTESPISANVLTEITNSFGNKIPMITAAMEGALSQYEIEVADPLTDVNLLRMLMDFLYRPTF